MSVGTFFQRLTRRDSWGRRLFIAAGVFVLLLVAGVAGLWLWKRHQINVELARIRAAGEPVTAADLGGMYHLPPGAKDSTVLWLNALGAVEGWPNDLVAHNAVAGVQHAFEELPSPDQLRRVFAEAETVLHTYSEVLRQLHQAAETDGAARYPVDFRGGLETRLPHLITMRSGAQLLVLEALVRAHRGDTQGATKSLDAIFCLANSVEQEPLLVSHAVRMTCDAMARQQIQWLLPMLGFSDDDLARLQQRLRTARYEEGLQRAMRGERVFGITVFYDSFASAGIWWRCVGWWDDLQYYLRVMDQIIEATARPIGTAQRDVERLVKELARPTYPLSFALLPGKNVLMPTARHTALNRAADAAITVERYRRRQGRLPQRLEELVPEFLPQVPGDAFDGKPLRYAAREDGYVVYSVGADQADNGGEGNDRGEPDLVFRVRLVRQTKETTEGKEPPMDAD